MKKEKEKEPEKAEKQEMSMLRKKGFEEEKKDSDDSDEVWLSISRQERTDFLLVRLAKQPSGLFFLILSRTGNQSRRPETLQEEAAQDEQADCG